MLIMSEFTEPTFGILVSNVGRLMRKVFDQRAGQVGLSLAQARAIIFLSRNEGIHQARLAELLETQPISLARLLDRMQTAGWVERRPDPADRRVHRLYLSPKARPVVDSVQDMAAATRADALAGLSADEQAVLIQLLSRVHANLCKADSCSLPQDSSSEPHERNE